MVLDKVENYINIPDNGIAGQTAAGVWYCKELPFKDAEDLKTKANKVVVVLNALNAKTLKKEVKK